MCTSSMRESFWFTKFFVCFKFLHKWTVKYISSHLLLRSCNTTIVMFSSRRFYKHHCTARLRVELISKCIKCLNMEGQQLAHKTLIITFQQIVIEYHQWKCIGAICGFWFIVLFFIWYFISYVVLFYFISANYIELNWASHTTWVLVWVYDQNYIQHTVFDQSTSDNEVDTLVMWLYILRVFIKVLSLKISCRICLKKCEEVGPCLNTCTLLQWCKLTVGNVKSFSRETDQTPIHI